MTQKRVSLSEAQFDEYFERVLDALEEINNHKYLLVQREEA